MSSTTSSISPEALGEAMEVGAAAGTSSTSPDSPSSSSPTATHPNFRIAPVGTATKQHAEAALQLQRSLRPHTERNQPGKRPCDRCRRSKVKCDREQPCNQCVKRKEACTYDVPVMRPGRIAVHEMAAFAYKDIPWVTFRGRLKTSSAESTRRRRTSSAGTAKSLEHVHFDDSSDAGDSSASSSWSTASTTVLEQRAVFEFDPSPSSAPTHAAAAAAFASGSSAPPTPQVLDHPTNATSWSASTLCDSPGAANAAKGKSPESSKNHSMTAPISLPTPNGQTTSASTSASPTRPAPFSDLYERGSDDELTPMWTVKQDKVARQTLDIASSEATAVPHVYRRYPVKGFGLLALQQHLMGSLEDPTPFIPCYHTPYRYKVRAMAVGNSIQRASLRRPHVILLDSQGLLQAVSTSECSLDLRYLFNQQWHTLDHRGQAISPPWHLLNEQNDRIDTIWPANVNNGLADVQGTEADYDDAREQAQKLLANAATSHLIEIEYNCKSHFSILSGHTINEYLTQIVDHSGSQQWSPTQDRHRRALLLSIAVASAQYTGQLPLRVGNVETSLSLWEFAFSAMKLAWRLLRPRQGQHFAREELSVEALVALTHLVDAMRSHPQHAFLSLAVKRLVTNPAIHQALVLDTSGNPDAQQSLVRLYAFHVRETVAFRLWHNIDTPLRFRHLFEMLVPLQPRPGELIDERQGGGLMRQKAREEIFAAKLDLMNEEILDSALLQTLPSPEQTAERRSVMLSREIQSESFFLRLLEWKQAALHIDYPSSVPLTFERPSQPSLLDPHLDWRNCSEVLLNLFVSSLEIIAASLREINSSHFSQAVQKEIDTTPTFAQIKATRMGDWLMSSATYFRTRRYAEGAIRGRRSKP